MNENFNQELFKAIDTIRNKQQASIESIFEQMIKTPNESIWKSLFEDRIGALVTNDLLEKNIDEIKILTTFQKKVRS